MSRFIEPYPLKAKLLAWSEFNVSEIDTILFVFRSQNVPEIYLFLEKLLDLNSSYLKSKVVLDLHYYAIKFAIENELTKIQISSFLSILRALHNANQETPFENYEFIVKYFQELVICHSIKRPPFCIDIFDSQVAIKVINYITNTYLKHYKLYKYAFTPIVGLKLKLDYSNRTPSPIDFETELGISNIDEISSVNNDSNKKSSGLSMDTFDEDSVQAEMRSYVKKLMLEHLESNEVKKSLEEIEPQKMELSARVPSRSNNKIKK